ncbi:MAG TPA: MFS transporter [Candidatus Hodarchaeales archaeon]|nr:MFS transporter [Candidatus Hodarchaeales archaeon]
MIRISYILTLIGLFCLSLFSGAVLLIIGHIVLALNYSIMRPVIFALTGDIATKENLPYVSALVWMIQSVSIVAGLVLGKFLPVHTLFQVSFVMIAVCGVFVYLILRTPLEKIRAKIAAEVSH